MKTVAERGFDRDTNRSMGYLLRDASRRILRLTAERLEAEHDLSLSQYFVMRELWQHEGLTQREIAGCVGVLEPAMVATIDALAQGGFIERVRSSSDRRKIHIMLTERGRALEKPALAVAADVLGLALTGVEPDELATMRNVLTRIKQNIADGT